jgi:GntR family transcriptional regulator
MWQDARPIYLQIRDLIVGGILDGHYKPGDPVPSVRALAAERNVNPLTVSKAYQELQNAGLIAARRGLGVYVEPGAPEAVAKAERQAFLNDQWPRIRHHIERLGLTAHDLFERSDA